MNKKMLMGGFIAFIMVFSIFGFIADSFISPKLRYNDFSFKVVDNQLVTKIDGRQYSFYSFPEDLKSFGIDSEASLLLAQPVLTITYDSNSSDASLFADIQYYIEQQLKDVRVIERAVTNEGSSLPKRDCSDASESQPVILLKSGEPSISVEGNCIILSGENRGLLMVSERVVYSVLGVMP